MKLLCLILTLSFLSSCEWINKTKNTVSLGSLDDPLRNDDPVIEPVKPGDEIPEAKEITFQEFVNDIKARETQLRNIRVGMSFNIISDMQLTLRSDADEESDYECNYVETETTTVTAINADEVSLLKEYRLTELSDDCKIMGVKAEENHIYVESLDALFSVDTDPGKNTKITRGVIENVVRYTYYSEFDLEDNDVMQVDRIIDPTKTIFHVVESSKIIIEFTQTSSTGSISNGRTIRNTNLVSLPDANLSGRDLNSYPVYRYDDEDTALNKVMAWHAL